LSKSTHLEEMLSFLAENSQLTGSRAGASFPAYNLQAQGVSIIKHQQKHEHGQYRFGPHSYAATSFGSSNESIKVESPFGPMFMSSHLDPRVLVSPSITSLGPWKAGQRPPGFSATAMQCRMFGPYRNTSCSCISRPGFRTRWKVNLYVVAVCSISARHSPRRK